MASVAAAANVSVSTVYMTLNHRHRVRPETRKRVEEAMRRVGYTSKKGNNKRTRGEMRPLRIAFIYTLETVSVEDPAMSSYAREIIAGIKAAVAAGTTSSVTILRGGESVTDDGLVTEHSRDFDGVILFGAHASRGYLEHLQASGVPLVVINRLPEQGRYSCVTLDYYGGAKLAIDHLVSLGHRRIAVANCDYPGKWLVQEWCAGARDALNQHGLEPIVELYGGSGVPSAEERDNFCRQVIDRRVTAVFTGDKLAVQCSDALMQLGVRVPDDVSVMGFDNRGFATAKGLSLSSIGYDKRRMGMLAVRTLQHLRQARGRLRWLTIAVSTYLVRGQTTAAPPSDDGEAGESPEVVAVRSPAVETSSR